MLIWRGEKKGVLAELFLFYSEAKRMNENLNDKVKRKSIRKRKIKF